MDKNIVNYCLVLLVGLCAVFGASAEDTIEFSGEIINSDGEEIGPVRILIWKYRKDRETGKTIIEKESDRGGDSFSYGFSKWDCITFKFVKSGYKTVSVELSAVDKSMKGKIEDAEIVLHEREKKSEKEISESGERLIEFLKGDDTIRDKLLESGAEGMKAIEDFISIRDDSKKIDIPGLIEQLGDKDFKIRESATERLSRLPETEIAGIREIEKKNKDPEIRIRLKKVREGIENYSDRKPMLIDLLKEMYKNNSAAVMDKRFGMVMKDPKDMKSLYAVDQVPFKTAWKLLEAKPDDTKLTYLLLKIYAGNFDDIRSALRKFKAADILRIAEATWWPIEIEPIKKDGSYGWTTRAESIEGNMARNLLRIGVKMPNYGNVKERGEWTHVYQWGEINYIFTFPPYVSKNVIGFYLHYRRPHRVVSWMNQYQDSGRKRPDEYRCHFFRGWPSTARLPKAYINRKEIREWTTGQFYKWGEPFIPEKIKKQIKIIENKYPEPKIDMPKKEEK